ncbi:unnamed protein product, partial [marine sediment metagenome]
LKLKQTSKGIWFCDGLTIEHEQAQVLVTHADLVMAQVEGLLKEHNKETE